MSARFTPLESDILNALAWDLRDVAPDLAGQYAEALPGIRRNTGSGLFTEIIVHRARPAPLTTPTGWFGTVHAMVGDLPDPIAFQVELVAGRLIALHGDAYGQDTRAIDFARVPYDQVFTLNDQGDSIAFDPAALMRPSPLLDPQRHADDQTPYPFEPTPDHLAPFSHARGAGPNALEVLFGKIEPASREAAIEGDPPDKADETSVLIGLWVFIAVVAFLAVALFDVSIVFAAILAGVLARTLHRPGVLKALTRATRRLGQYEYRPPRH